MPTTPPTRWSTRPRRLWASWATRSTLPRRAKIQAAVDHLKEVNKGTDVEAIKAATEEVQKAFYAVSEKLYQQAGAQQGQPQDGQTGNKPGDDGVVDADYETVD